ncbi:sulfotransferase domain-containing protein [Microbulbifer bruguierae]|uniref:Sulfotransferase domain-containing protein n=1 Tax=Microbulbifer bruguierae TaxID=3029061 RepID=A0ABY8ND91_9GAMM|nr:sulfotransferase domain-containing protein [Microbulbifer bruguierae]WGL16399.1 sulfotransferase domain-containing protein [Microbulbifer bruguierae]
MRVLIYGLSKSGTTFLAAIVKASLERRLGKASGEVFEPKALSEEGGELCYLDKGGNCMAVSTDTEVVKTLFDSGVPPEQVLEHQKYFDKKIFITRDPRDRLLSHLFYRWNASHSPDPERFSRVLRLTLHKEKHPRDLPVSFLLHQNPGAFQGVPYRMKAAYRAVTEFVDAAGDDWLIFRYEDLVDGNLSRLEEYLGMPVATNVSVSSGLKRVVRTKAHGNWRRWFTAEDVQFFRPIFKPYMESMGYDFEDWELEECESLPGEQGSQYMLKMFSAPASQGVARQLVRLFRKCGEKLGLG